MCYLGIYTNLQKIKILDFQTIVRSTKKIIAYKHLVTDYSLRNKRFYALLILFTEVGKIFIEKKECIIAIENIIKYGILNYKKLNKNVCFIEIY